MPEYYYRDPDDKSKVVSVVQSMNDEHVFVDFNGKKWERIWFPPQVGVAIGASEIDPFDTRKCADKMGDMRGTIGDMWDFSKEMSERRADKLGHEDPVKRKFLDDYKKKNGSRHMDDLPKKIETEHVTIDLTNPHELPKGGAFDLPVSED